MYTMASCLPTATRTTGSKAAARGALTELLLLLHGKLRGAPFPPTPARASEHGEKGQGDLGTGGAGPEGGQEVRPPRAPGWQGPHPLHYTYTYECKSTKKTERSKET
jgi:hypothetical protein